MRCSGRRVAQWFWIVAVAWAATVSSLPAQATPFTTANCRDTAYVRAFSMALAGRVCEEVTRVPVRWRGGFVEMRVLRVLELPLDGRSNEAIGWIRQAALSVAAAMDQMGSGLALHDVTIMMTNLPRPVIDGVTAWAYAAHDDRYPEQCLVPVFLQNDAIDPALAKFNFAHEMFHCIQYATWGYASVDTGPERKWWVEGSAQYFAELAFPGTPYSAHLAPLFVGQAFTASLLDMSYEAVVFFAWLGGRHGPPAVKRFLDQVSRGRSRDDYRALAERALPPSDWQNFASAFVGRTIRLPRGATPIGADPASLPRHDIDAGVIRLQGAALVVIGAIVRFPQGAKYTLRVLSAPGSHGATRTPELAAWPVFPVVIEVPCEEAQDHFVAAMSAAPAGQRVGIEGRPVGPRRTCTSCVMAPDAPRDACLLGTWRYEGLPSYCSDFGQRMQAGASTLESCRTPTGEVTFGPDGSVTSVLRNAQIVVQTDAGMRMEINHDRADGRARWAAAGGTVQFCDAKTSVTGTRRFVAGPMTRASPVRSVIDGGLAGSASYECTPGRLTLRSSEGAPMFLGQGSRAELRR